MICVCGVGGEVRAFLCVLVPKRAPTTTSYSREATYVVIIVVIIAAIMAGRQAGNWMGSPALFCLTLISVERTGIVPFF